MANAIYPKAKQALLTGGINWTSNDIRVALVRSTYTYNTAHEFMSDITSGNENGRSGALTGKSATNGVADADDTTLTATSNVACNALVVFVHTGSDATARVLAYLDTVTGLPFSPGAGQTVNIAWDNGANKIFAL